MTQRSFWLWVFGVGVLGITSLVTYLLVINDGTLQIRTEASFVERMATAIPRGGILVSYDEATDILIFTESETGTESQVLVDETTALRYSSESTEGQFLDASTNVLRPGLMISIILEPTTTEGPAGAVDVAAVEVAE